MSTSLKRKRSDAAPGSRPGPDLAEERPEPKRLAAACTACRKQKVDNSLLILMRCCEEQASLTGFRSSVICPTKNLHAPGAKEKRSRACCTPPR